jgi:hypothetical protein
MKIDITDYIDISEKTAELGLQYPSGIAILPNNLESASNKDEFYYESSTSTIRKLFKLAGIEETQLEIEGKKPRQIVQLSSDWISPIIFLSYTVINDGMVPIVINIISSYLYDILKSNPDDSKVKVQIVIENETTPKKKKQYKKVTFEGNQKALESFKDQFKEIVSSK